MKKSNLFRRLCAVSLSAVTVMSLFNRDVIQADEKTLYVSAIMLFQAEEIGDAVADCKAKGYIPLEQDLNYGTGEDAVILGYQTTENRDDAITDLSVLNMGAGYEIRSYQEILDLHLDQFTTLAEETFRIIPEFRRNHNKKDL